MAPEIAHPPLAEAAPKPPVRRALYLSLAGVFFVLAILGIALPVLPTTPFLLLTSWFLVRSSPRMHERLLASRVFGPVLREWQERRAVRPRVKVISLVMMSGVVVLSAASGRLPAPLLAALIALAGIGFVVVLRLPVIRD